MIEYQQLELLQQLKNNYENLIESMISYEMMLLQRNELNDGKLKQIDWKNIEKVDKKTTVNNRAIIS